MNYICSVLGNKTKNLILLYLIVFECNFNHIIAKQSATDYVASQKVLSIEDGLASREVFCTIQDDDGFIWFGTRNGLDRYDGKNVQHFTQQKNNLAGNRIIHLAKDAQNRLIVLYGHPGYSRSVGAIQVFDLKTNKVLSVKEAFPNLPFDEAYLFWVTNDGNDLCFLTSKPFQYWRYTKKGFVLMSNMTGWNDPSMSSEELKTRNAPKHCAFGRNSIFYNDQAVLYYDEKKPLYLVTPQGSIEQRFTTKHRPIAISSSKKIIHDIQDITYQYNGRNNWQRIPSLFPKTMFKKEDEVYLCYSNKNELITIERNSGIQLMDSTGFRFISSLNDLNLTDAISVYSFYTDRQGIHWIATANGVIKLYLRKNPFTHYFTKQQLKNNSNNQVRGMLLNAQNHVVANIWTSIYRSNSTEVIPHQEILYGITQHNGVLYSGSIYLNALREHGLETMASPSSKDELWTLDSLNDHELLLGSSQKLMRYNIISHNISQVTYAFSMPAVEFVYRFIHRNNGTIWAVAQNGLYLLNKKADSILLYYGKGNKTFPPSLQYALSNMLDAYENEDGSIWIATNGDGLYEWNRTKNNLNHYTSREGLPSEILYRIEADSFQNLWVSTDNGLFKINTVSKRVNVYTITHGLSHNEFNRTSSYHAKNGRLFFGGINGINAFNPRDFVQDTFSLSAPIRIIRFNQFSGKENKLLDVTDTFMVTKKIILEPNDKFFNLEFQLLDYRDGGSSFAYQIEGYDADWNYIKENTLRVSGLPAGHYTLKIKGQGSNGQWSQQVLSIPVEVKNHFYKQVWFLAFMIILFILSVILIIRWRTKNLLISKQALERTVNSRTEQLKNSLDEKEVLLKEIHHRVKNNLEVISSILELQSIGIKDPEAKAAIIAGQSRVHSIALIHHKLYQSNHVSQLQFHSFIEELFSQVKQVLLPMGTSVDLKVKGEDILLPLDIAVPLGLILNELLTNSFKYAVQSGKQHVFTLTHIPPSGNNELHVIRYDDHGPGLPPDFNLALSNSLGMKIIQLLTRQIGGEIRIISDQGTTFEIPFNKTRQQS